jgi:hypothetical protein
LSEPRYVKIGFHILFSQLVESGVVSKNEAFYVRRLAVFWTSVNRHRDISGLKQDPNLIYEKATGRSVAHVP